MFFVINTKSQTIMMEGKLEHKVKYKDSLTTARGNIFIIDTDVMQFKNNKFREDFISPGDPPQMVFYDDSTQTEMNLNELQSVKIARVSHFDSLSAEYLNKKKIDFKYTDETKIILGYKCRKAIYKMESDTNIRYVYFTNDFICANKYIVNRDFPGLEGFPMEWNFYDFTSEVIVSVVKINFEKINDSVFKLPKGYKLTDAPKRKEY